MFGFSICCSILIVLSISLQNESGHVFNTFYENQEDYYSLQTNHDFNVNNYHVSNHVFYWLYTRNNANGQKLNRNNLHMIESTTYNVKNPIIVIVHGWLGTTQEKDGLCSYIMKSYLSVSDYNVICVDWKQYSTDIPYVTAKMKAKYIGKDIANVLQRITRNMSEGVDNLHLIGHSMGAHIVGFTGKILTNQIPRITGLDPAKPGYSNSNPENRLDKNDGHFVDVIHTNGDNYGILWSLGNIDFFPNGGKTQPNCKQRDKKIDACSHSTSYHYFAHSIRAKKDYVAFKCNSWDDYKQNKCLDAIKTYMGEYVNKKQTGDYYLDAYVPD